MKIKNKDTHRHKNMEEGIILYIVTHLVATNLRELPNRFHVFVTTMYFPKLRMAYHNPLNAHLFQLGQLLDNMLLSSAKFPSLKVKSILTRPMK